MGDTRKNTFGGKNNVFPDRNKKNNTNRNRQEPNKLLGIFIAAVFIFGLATAGLDGVVDVFSSVVDTVKELGSTDYNSKEIEGKNIKDDSGISDEAFEKVKNALENFAEENDIPKKITLLNYKHLENEKKFRKQVEKAFKRVKKDTMYVYAVSENFDSPEEMSNETDRTKEMFSKIYEELNEEYASNDKVLKIDNCNYGTIQIDAYRLVFIVIYRTS